MNTLYNEWVKYLKPKGVKLPKEDTWGRKSLEFMYVNLNAWVSKEIIIEGIGYTGPDLQAPRHFSASGWYCLLYTSPSPRDATLSRMPSSA